MLFTKINLKLPEYFGLRIRFPYLLSFVAIFFGFISYWDLTINITNGEGNHLASYLFYIDLLILLIISVFIARRLAGLWTERRLGLKGSKLHVHIAALFAFVSVTPAIIVALFSAHFLNSGVEAWFGKPVKDALQQASVVAESYLKEHKNAIKFDAVLLAEQLRPQMSHLSLNHDELCEYLTQIGFEKKLNEIMIFEMSKQPKIIGRSYITFLPLIEDLRNDFKRAKKEGLVLIESKDRVRAIKKLDNLTDTYLFIGKIIDPVVLEHVNKTNSAISDYRLLAGKHSNIQIHFALFFAIVALLLLMSAIWLGLTIADLMVQPITKLIKAAQSVSEGDLSIKLETNTLNNELDDLCLSFNRMTQQLLQQKHDLILSEKKSAWADMARKIAHEIKNPLTPIQLSAERLKRRYLRQIQNDPETFLACIDTIIRQVSSIGSLVSEFSNFARMPEPKLEYADWVILCQQAIFLQKEAHPNINFELSTNFMFFKSLFDPLQMSQVLTNLLQNSINALNENKSNLIKQQSFDPKIKISLHIEDVVLYIIIEDNGPGFPNSSQDKLMEPYYTTRETGTGLGLAIVSKIVSDHHGRIELTKSIDLLGASVILSFPIKERSKKGQENNVT